MALTHSAGAHDRRAFLKEVAAAGGALALTGGFAPLPAQIAPNWKNQIGLELYTVRDLLAKDYEGTIARVAEMGYKEVEPADPYNKMEPKQYRALLDRHKLSMPSTHSGATEGPDLEKQLEGFQIMGIKYTEVRPARPGLPAGGSGGRGAAGAPQRRPAMTVESVKHSAGEMNRLGQVVRKFGMKILIHNHSGEFELLEDGRQTQYDVLLAETDPAVVAMQIDIGWAEVAGKNVLQMFRANPGRYELWHVKDATVKNLDSKATPLERQRAAKIVPMGEGDIDYKTIFANAHLAGLKYFVIEQDSAGQVSGDALADCKVAYQNLHKILS